MLVSLAFSSFKHTFRLRHFRKSLYKPRKILNTNSELHRNNTNLEENRFHCTNMWLVNKAGAITALTSVPTYAAENQLQNEGNLNRTLQKMPKI